MNCFKIIFLSLSIFSVSCAELQELGFKDEIVKKEVQPVKLTGVHTIESFLKAMAFAGNDNLILGSYFELRIKYFESPDISFMPLTIERGARIVIERRPKNHSNECIGGRYGKHIK